MRRLALTALLLASTAVGACSLINAPGEVIPGGAGGEMSTTASVSASSASVSSAESSSAASTTGGPMCMDAAGCKAFNDACNDGVCTAGMCAKMPKADGTTCDDGMFCTTADVCSAGVCAGSTRVCPDVVDTTSSSSGTGGAGGAASSSSASGGMGTGGGPAMLDACHVWACNEGLKVCEIVPGTSGIACSSGDACIVDETCAPNGTCGNGVAKDCSPLDSECAQGICTPGLGCELVPNAPFEGFPCDGNNTCAVSKCVAGKCNLVSPKNTGSACDDKVNCTTNDVCQPNGFCGGSPACVSLNPCTDAVCDEAAGGTCNFPGKVNGSPCVLPDPCAAGNVCQGGACGGGTITKSYFYDSFDDNNKGWLLGPEWGIAHAEVSPMVSYGSDPAFDHSPVGNGGVAGVVIGGNESPVIHAPYYIESSVINITLATGELYLTYYRWLNSDYLPYMRNMVEVFNGIKWVEVWTSGSSPGIQDSPPVGTGWTFQAHNITAYKNPLLKVRFGYEIKSGGAFTIGSWNLDDVKLQNIACPSVP